MTALDERPAAAPVVSQSVAIRRANGVRSGRALTARELDEMALSFPETVGATNVGDLTSYQANLLGIGSVSAYEQRQIEWAEDTLRGTHDEVWRERYEAQARVRRAVGQ